jgi:asparagine synthase (glutamine-hydrolysing)
MGRHLAARGPDGETILTRPDFRVVFRRLAIVDVEGGRQPFVVDGGRYAAVVNGEIYNYRDLVRQYASDINLATASDCEIVVHLYRKIGAGFLRHLNGIYAIAIWDEAERRLLLARDRLGVKPLYYAPAGGALLFASELKALLVHPDSPRELDWDAFYYSPASPFPFDRPGARRVATGVRDVAFVDPGSYIEWQDGRVGAPVKYWSLPAPGTLEGVTSVKACVDRYADLLEDSVRLQLMSDVPVGVALSGGLDSALVAGIASRWMPGLEAFTLVEPSIGRTGDTDAAVELSRHLGLRLHRVRVDRAALEATIGLDLATLEYLIWVMDFPLFDVEFLFKHELSRHAKISNPDLKVMLLGQGADEFAGGYSRLHTDDWTAFTSGETRVLQGAALRQQGIPVAYHPFINPSLSAPLVEALAGPHDPWQFLRLGDLAAFNLWHEDRTAAANGVEARVPFLDHRLVELLCAIPARWRERLFFDKAIERRAARRFLPRRFTERPKIPLYKTGPGADESIGALRRGFLDGAFDDYCEKYLDGTDALFSRSGLRALRDEAAVPGTGDAAWRLVFRCMAISIFDRVCRGLAHPEFVPPRLPAVASPLTEQDVAAPARPGSAITRIEMYEPIHLALTCDEPPAVLVIHGQTLAAQIRLPAEWDWGTVPPAVLSGRYLELADLARALGVDVHAVQPLAEAFVARGWGTAVARED